MKSGGDARNVINQGTQRNELERAVRLQAQKDGKAIAEKLYNRRSGLGVGTEDANEAVEREEPEYLMEIVNYYIATTIN